MRSISLLLSGLSAVLLASAAGAAPVSDVDMTVRIDGAYYGSYDETQLGCSAGAGDTFWKFGRMFRASPVTRLRR